MNIDNKGIIDIESCPRRQPPSQEEVYYRNLSGADFSKANLDMVHRICADLTGAVLSKVDLRRTDLRSADLREKNLIDLNLTGANKDMLDHHLHHLNNTESGSLLTFIDSLGNDHQKSRYSCSKHI